MNDKPVGIDAKGFEAYRWEFPEGPHPLDLEELERLAASATVGPWVFHESAETWDGTDIMGVRAPNAESALIAMEPTRFHAYASGAFVDPEGEAGNLRFIAAAREALPALIAEVRRLRALLGEQPLASAAHARPLPGPAVPRRRTAAGQAVGAPRA